MARLRNKSFRENGADGPSPPTNGAELPPVAEKQSAEPPAVENAVRAAESSALKARLAEMDRAEELVREALQQQPRLATEPPAIEPEEPQEQPLTVEQIVASSGLPKRAQDWLLQHPEYVTDLAKNEQLQKLHHVAEYQAGDAFSDMYYERLDRLLGLKPETNGAAQPVHRQLVRQSAPVRQQGAVPVSAPPHRDVPSMSTGRAPTRRAPLTQAQREAARYSGISEQEYAEQLEKYEFQKAQGMHQQEN
jgi:hypothetical protein